MESLLGYGQNLDYNSKFLMKIKVFLNYILMKEWDFIKEWNLIL